MLDAAKLGEKCPSLILYHDPLPYFAHSVRTRHGMVGGTILETWSRVPVTVHHRDVGTWCAP